VDFSDIPALERYLSFYDGWLRKCFISPDFVEGCRFIREHLRDKDHRVLACHLLAARGNPTARLFARAFSGRITKSEYENWSFDEKQGEGDFGIYAFFLMLWTSICRLFSLGRIVKKTSDIVDTLSPILNAIGNVAELCRQVWIWVKDFAKKLAQKNPRY